MKPTSVRSLTLIQRLRVCLAKLLAGDYKIAENDNELKKAQAKRQQLMNALENERLTIEDLRQEQKKQKEKNEKIEKYYLELLRMTRELIQQLENALANKRLTQSRM